MDSRRKLFVVAGGLAVGVGVVLAVRTEEPLYAGLLGIVGALVSGWQAPTGKQGLRNGVLSAVAALPVVLVGVAAVVALGSREGAESFGVMILGMVFLLSWILVALLVPLMIVGALAGYLRGNLTDLEPEPAPASAPGREERGPVTGEGGQPGPAGEQQRGRGAGTPGGPGGADAGGHGRTGAPGREDRGRTTGGTGTGTGTEYGTNHGAGPAGRKPGGDTGSAGDYAGGDPTDRPNTWSVTEENADEDTGPGHD